MVGQVKKLARSMIRQIEASEERAELIETKMAHALTSTIPRTGSSVGGGPAKPAPVEQEPPISDVLRARERALLEEAEEEDGPILEEDN